MVKSFGGFLTQRFLNCSLTPHVIYCNILSSNYYFLINMETVSQAKDLEFHALNNDNEKNFNIQSSIPEICKTEPCILGVDEAGRGPVLGPMVYGICYCPLSQEKILKDEKCSDSKTLTEIQREEIFANLCKLKDSIGWIVEAISPNVISNEMYRRQKCSLNQIAQNSTVSLIQKCIDSGVNVTEIYVDTVGMPDKYQAKLSEFFPTIKITVAKKADAIYPIVSAASICAKVSRDRILKVWKFKEGYENFTCEQFGSGYPNDPLTKKFLQDVIDPIFGFPKLVRFSWSTAEKIISEKGAPVEWEKEDEENSGEQTPSIKSFFKPKVGTTRNKHKFFIQRHLTNTINL